MSRYHQTIHAYKHNNETVDAIFAYGFDHSMGYFYQVFVPSEQAPVEDHDSWRGLQRSELLERITQLNADIPDAHRTAIVLDLPF